MSKKEYIFRIKPKFKQLIKIRSAEIGLNNSELVNVILKSTSASKLEIRIYVNKSKLNYDNIQASYMLEESNKKKIDSIALKYNLKNSQVMNLFLSYYFDVPL